MKMQISIQDPLKEALSGPRLFTDWIAGTLQVDFLIPEHREALREWQLALAGSQAAAPEVAPLFRSGWVDRWAESMATDLASDRDRAHFQHELGALQAGQARVVVTGQQPGFLGGPLYTLLKIATAVAVARRRTAAGHPTVPVFWSGDADDDLTEALHPLAWDPAGGGLFRSPALPGPTSGKRYPRLGTLAADPWSAAGADWLEKAARRSEPGSLSADLAAIWRAARFEGWDWARLTRRSLLRVFSGHGLVVVSGDDSGLHEAAGPLYDRIKVRAGVLADLTSGRGGDLTAGGWHAQINARSVARPLFAVAGDQRTPLSFEEAWPGPGRLRPGVMLRSPVQDWLLRPAAVVAGPGEVAYLRQLDPVYQDLGIRRPPLVPRLFAWLVPTGFDPEQLRDFRAQGQDDPQLAEHLTRRAEEGARTVLTDLLRGDLGLDRDRAQTLAAGRSRRWGKGVLAMFRDEIQRLQLARAPREPVWVFPEGARQERRLASLCAAALWGTDLIDTLVEAAGRHLELGSQGDWREFTIEVPARDE